MFDCSCPVTHAKGGRRRSCTLLYSIRLQPTGYPQVHRLQPGRGTDHYATTHSSRPSNESAFCSLITTVDVPIQLSDSVADQLGMYGLWASGDHSMKLKAVCKAAQIELRPTTRCNRTSIQSKRSSYTTLCSSPRPSTYSINKIVYINTLGHEPNHTVPLYTRATNFEDDHL